MEEEPQPLSIEMRMPVVIDDEMLTKAVYDQGPQDYAGKIAREEGINFGDVKKLRLDYRSRPYMQGRSQKFVFFWAGGISFLGV